MRMLVLGLRALVLSLAGLALAVSFAVAASPASDNLQGCVQSIHPIPLSNLTGASPVGTVQDVGNLTVMELTGAYDRGLDAPRQQVAARFFADHPDNYDFLVVFTTFEFPTGVATAFYNGIRNDTVGIGQPMYDFGVDYGSPGKLQGYIDMAAMSRYSFVPDSSTYQQTLNTLAHEMMHRWAAHIHFIDAGGNNSPDLLGQDNAHWSYFLDSNASVMYGNDWQLQGDGKFRSIDVRHRYGPLDLYLAGFSAPSEVAPLTLIRNGDGGVATSFPVLGAISGGQGETITIDQVIAASGTRVPAAAGAQKDFTGAMILLKRPGENVSSDFLLELERFRVRFQQEFVQMTDGRGVVRVYTQPLKAVGAGLPTILHGSGATASPTGVAGAIAWLESRQATDGHWEDRPATAMRDTVAVARALSELDAGFSGLAAARAWIRSYAVVNQDQHAWKLIGANLADDATALAATQDTAGGFAIEPGWKSSPFDTALVASALAGRDPDAPSLSTALQLVGSQQNGDGSFGVATGGRGRVLPTLRAATFMASSGNSIYATARQHAADWITAQQAQDGGIGSIEQSSLVDTIETYALLGRVQPALQVVTGTRTFVRQNQQIAGDWGGSIYLTATAALAYAHDQRGNLAFSGVPTSNPAQPHDGELVTLKALVANTGNVPVQATAARWYDGDPDHGGVQIGADIAVPSLVAGQTVSIMQSWGTSGHTGDHVLWLLLDADAAVSESSEQDNRGSVAVTVGAPSSLPDLALAATDFALTPSAVSSLPSTVHLSGTLRNLGTMSVSGAVVRLYAMPDVTHALAETTVDVAGRSSAPLGMDFNVTAPATLNLLVRADPDNSIAEAGETNNDASLVLPFGQSLDFEVTPADIAPVETTPFVGQDIDFDVTLHNRGTVDSPPATFHAEVVQNGTTATIFDASVQIAAGQSQMRRVTWRTGQPGAAQLRVAVDPGNQVVETREDNNSAQLDFNVSALSQADLTFVSDSLAFIPTPGVQGQPLSASLRVRNLSSVATGSFRLALYAADPRTGVPALGSATVVSLAGSSDTTVTINVPDLGITGDQILYAFIDADNQIAEIDETNNVIIAPLHVVPLPDIAISVADIALNPALPVPGQPVQAQVTVRNLGGQDAHGVVVRLLEGDAPSGAAVGADQNLATLAAGASAVVTWNWTLGVVPNSRVVTALADPDNSAREGSEDNNVASLPFDVQDGDFFANERYISPNGDGVQDETAIVFVMPQAGSTEVDVVNGAQYTVRHFTNVQLNDALRGQVIWDGRDDRGRIVPDGDYHVAAIDANHQSHAGPMVTVDNNLSSVLEAFDTQYGVYGELPHDNIGNYMYGTQIPPITSQLRDQLFGFWKSPTTGFGLYRTDTLFSNAVPVISGSWIENFRQAQHLQIAVLNQYAFTPDGRNLVVGIYGGAVGSAKLWILTTAVDQVDAPKQVAIIDGLYQPPVFGYFDADTIVVGPTSDGMLQTIAAGAGGVTPLRSFADAQSFDSTPQITIVPTGILLSEQNGAYYSNKQVFLPRDPARAAIQLNSMTDVSTTDVDNGRDYAYYGHLSPQKTTVAVYERNAQIEKVDLVDLVTGTRRTLLQNAPALANGQLSGNQLSVGRYGIGWLEKQDELLVQDAATRSLVTFSESGQRLSEADLPSLQRVGQYAIDGFVFPLVPLDLISTNCNYSVDNAALGVERRIYDPTSNRLFLRFGEMVVNEEQPEGSYAFILTEGIRDYFTADIDSGAVDPIQQSTLTPLTVNADTAQHPLRQSCVDTPPPDAPELILGDGARIRTDRHVQTLSRGVLSKAWTEQIDAIWPDETRVLLFRRTFSSLLNLTAELQARTLGRGIELSGVATDRNFAYYQLDWAPIEQPNNWRVLTPASSDQIFLEEFLTWVPPQAGTFVIRLTIVDKAGNRTSTTASASSFDSSAIDNFSLAPRYLSPNGDGVQDQLNVKYRVRVPLTLDIKINDANGNTVRSVALTYDDANLGSHEFDWDGRNDTGQVVPDGRYRVNVDGFAAWVTVDNTSPVLTGSLTQAYQAVQDCDDNNVCRHDIVAVAPDVKYSGQDTNLDQLGVEYSSKTGGPWLPAMLPLRPQQMGSYTFRVSASDRAGNTSSLSVGDGEEQLILSRITGQPVAYQPLPISGLLNVNTNPPIIAIPVDQGANDSLGFADESGYLNSVAVETAPLDAPDQWTQRGMADVNDDCPSGRCQATFDTTAMPLGSPAFLRFRGERADGSRLYSNQGYIRVGGIDPPVCDAVIGSDVYVHALEYYEGPLATAVLHFVSNTGVEMQKEAASISNDRVFFVVPARTDSQVRVDGIDARGFKHTSKTVQLSCASPPPPPPGSAWRFFVRPYPVVSRDQCDGQPGNRIGLELSTEIGSLSDVPDNHSSGFFASLPTHLHLSYTDGITNLPVVLFDGTVDQSNVATVGQRLTISTAQWPEGAYEGRLEATDTDGTVHTASVQMPVLKHAPQIDIVTPISGQRVCALPAPPPAGSRLPLAIEVNSPASSAYHIEIGAGAHPVSWACAASAGAVYSPQASCASLLNTVDLQGDSIDSTHPVEIDGGLEAYNGISTLRLKSVGWSGGTTCVDSTIYLDSDVEFLQRKEPTAYVPIPGTREIGISSTGDPKFAQASFFLRANEPVQVIASLYREGVAVATLKQIDSVQGDVDITWSGVIDGAVAPYGPYSVVITASDGCIHEKSIGYPVFVDATPPALALTAPLPGTSAAAAVIEIAGSAYDDTQLASWSLDYALAGSPSSWQNLASGTSPIIDPRVLKAWSRGSITGQVDIRLSALDAFGNRAEKHVSLMLLAPAKLIGGAELQPPLFSPNADGALDITRLQLSLLQNANLNIQVNNATLYTGPASAGTTGFVWDGKDGAGRPLADGTYPVVVNAQDPNGLASPESVTLSATIDNTPPSVTILQPNAAFAAADSSVRIHVDDAHFANYDASLTRSADNVVVASASGTQGGDVTLTALQGFQEGAYALHIVARDGAGNVTTRDSTFQLDATAPAMTLTNPDDDALIASATPTSVKGSVSDTHLASWTLSVAPETVDSWADLAQGTANIDAGEILAWTPNLPDGRYRLRLRGVDQAGNTTDVIHVVEVDGTSPVAHITSPASGSVVRGDFEIDGTATDAHFATYRVSVISASQLASGQWADVFVGTTLVDNAKLAALTLNLAEDNYFLRLIVTDKVGLSSNDQVSIRIDAQPPPVPLGLIGHVDNNRDSALDWNAVSASDLAGYYVYRGGAKITPTPIAAIHYIDQNAPEGRMQYYVTAIDQAGNESAPSNTVTLLIDHTPPSVAIARPSPAERVRGVYDIVGTAYSHDDFKQYRLTVQPINPAGATIALASSSLPVQGQKLASWNTLAIADETTVRIHLEAEDSSGNIGYVDVDVVVDNGPPVAPTGLTAVLAGVDVQTRWNPNSESDLLGYLLYRDNLLVNATGTFLPADLRPFALTDTQYLDKAVPDGTHTYVVYAIDRAGNVSPPSAPATLDPIDGHPPSMVIEQPANNTKFETSITVLATSPDGDIAQVQFAWRAQDAVSWTNFGSVFTSAPYRVVWVPPPGTPYGNYQIRALARDLGGRVDPAPPLVDVIYADLTPPDKPTSLAAHADADTVHLTWSASTATDLAGYRIYRGFSLLNGTLITATAYDDPGLYDADFTYTVTAVDRYGNESDPSASATAYVFSIALGQPYSPVSTATVDVTGTSARAGNIGVHVDTDHGSADSTAGATSDSGAITLAAQALSLGGNHLVVRVTDANGDISRPAEIWVDRGNVPAAPTGVAAVVVDHSVNVGWNTNSEADLLGYRVFRNGHASAHDGTVSEMPTSLGGNAAIDGDPNTAWVTQSFFGDPDASPDDPWIELDWTQPHIFTAANLTWMSADYATGNFDLYAWSGHTWIRVARARGAPSATQSIAFDKPYCTSRLKITVHGRALNNGPQTLELAELQLLERPAQSATNLAETVIDGTYHYQVSALSNFAFESPLSADAVATVGDTQGDSAVVLSGSLAGNDASLSWTASSSPAVVRYDLMRDGSVINSITASEARAYVDHGLSNGTHLYVVYAYDAVGNASAPSNTVSLTVAGVGPGVPIGLSVTAPAIGSELDESWQPGTGTTPDHYILRRAISSGGPFAEVDEPGDTFYFDTGLTNGTTYYYTVEAVDANGLASGPSGPVSGTPNDHIPPSAPVLTYPTVPQDPLTLHAITSEACGLSEAGAAIELDRDGVAVASTTALIDSNSAQFYIANSDHILPAPDGRHLASVDFDGAINVIQIGNFVSAYNSNGNTRLQSWANHGMTLYYAASGADDLFRWELGQPPQAIVQPVTQVSAFAVSADESTLAIVGTYTPNGGTAIDSVWLIAPGGTVPRRIDTLDPATLDSSHPLLWSPDGARLLVVDGGGSAHVVDVASASVTLTLNFDTSVQPSWSPDGKVLAYARANGQGSDDIVQFTLATQSENALVQGMSDMRALAWSPGNDAVAFVAGPALQVVNIADGTSPLNLSVGNWLHLTWTASGRIVADAGSNGVYADLPGWFCADSMPLVVGANHVSAAAIDPAGHRSISSAAIEIDTPTDHLPDLAVAAVDNLFLPPSGTVGKSYSALITLHNLGTLAVAQPVLAATLTAPDGGQQRLSPAAPLSGLAAGSAESATYALGTLNQPGSYRLDVVADPDHQLREANENNNSASSTLTLSADGKPVLELNLSRSVFAPGGSVSGDVAVTNPGSTFNGKVHLSALDTGNTLVADLGDLPIVALGFGQRWSAPVAWNAQGVFAGGYRIRAQLFGADGSSIADHTSAFTIAAVRHVQLALTPDATSQTIGHVVGLHSALNFSDGNALLNGATLRLVALDPNGVEVWHTQQALGTLLPGYVLGRDDVWPTAGLVQGVYTLRLSIVSPDLTQSTDATVALTAPAPSVVLGGSLTFDPGTTLIAGENSVLRYNVMNQGSGALSGVQARLRIVAGQNQTPVSEQDDQFDLAVAGTRAASLTLTAPPLVLTSHAAILEAHLASDAPGQWRLLAQQGFAVVDLLPPQITVLSPPSDVVQPAVVPFRASIIDLHSAVATAQVSVDGGSWQPISAGTDGFYARGLTGLVDGAHTLSIRASDTWGNQTQTAALPFTVDATPPVIIVTGVADGDMINHAVTPQVTITDAHLATSDVRLNGNTFISGTSIDQDGSYVLTARATDAAGNQSLASVRFVVDRTAPAVAITAPLDSTIVGQSAIHVDVQTEASARITLATGGYQGFATADNQGHAGFDNVPLILGANHIEASAMDGAGNVGGPAAVNVTYQQNAIAPLAGTLQPDTTELAYGTPLGISVLTQNPNATPLAAQQLRARVLDASMAALSMQAITHDFGANESFTTNLNFASTTWPLGALTLTLELNQAGTWLALDTKQITVVDRTPPLLGLNVPTEAAVLHGPVTLQATASDALSGIASVEARVDGGDWTALTASGAGAYASAVLALADGDHQAELRTHDGAGNLATVSPVHFAVDSVPPLINIAGVADGDLLAHAVAPTITITDAHLTTSDVRLNSQPYISGTPIVASGDYQVDVNAADAAGNQNSSSVHFTLDLNPPTVVFTAPAANAIVVTASIEVIGQTESLGKVHLTTGGFSVDTVADAAGVFDVTGVVLQAGANTLTAHATDRAGNVGQDATLVVTYQTVGLSGSIGPLVAQIPRGLPLDVPYTLHNTGNVAFSALPLRIELHAAAGGDAIISDDFTADLAGGADAIGTRQLVTTTLLPGDYTAALLANMPATPGPGGWITLDSAATVIFIDPCRRAGSDAIFANGFETGAAAPGDVIFCNGFEQLLANATAAKSFVGNANNFAAAFWHSATDAIPALRIVDALAGSELASAFVLQASERDAAVTQRAWHLPYSRAEARGRLFDDRLALMPALGLTIARAERAETLTGFTAAWTPDHASREWQ